jgi:hypothetical protein
MGYLSPHFEHDVFVSYSHADRHGKGTSVLKSWTLGLLKELEHHIVEIDPDFENLEIWRDERLDPTQLLTPELKANVKSSAILFIVMSPHYLKSSWCGDELSWFREQIQDRARDPERVFIIRAVRTDTGKWPEFLRDERGFAPVGFPFHHPEKDEPFCFAGSSADRDEYLKCLGTLRTTLMRRLRELRDRENARVVTRVPARSRPDGTRLIYLHARPEDAPIHEEVSTILSQGGVKLTSSAVSQSREMRDWNLESKIRIRTARRCDALALVRTETDENFVDTLLDIGLQEREVIQAERGTEIPCAVLDRTGEDLPIDVSTWGIERFDLRDDGWPGDFRRWLDEASPSSAESRL